MYIECFRGIELMVWGNISKYFSRKKRIDKRTITWKLITFGIVFIMVTIAFQSLLKNAAAGSGSYPPPENGDWIITEETFVQYETIVLNGNLIITETGKLTLYQSVLKMNCSHDG